MDPLQSERSRISATVENSLRQCLYTILSWAQNYAHASYPEHCINNEPKQEQWILATLVTGHWSLVTGHWSLVT